METISLANLSQELGQITKELSKFENVEEYISQLQNMAKGLTSPLLVMIMGEFSTGKSTFINALIGQEIASVNDTPTTAVITKLCYGATNSVTLHFKDDHTENRSIDELKAITSESGKQNEKLHNSIKFVEVALPIPF